MRTWVGTREEWDNGKDVTMEYDVIVVGGRVYGMCPRLSEQVRWELTGWDEKPGGRT